MPFDNPETRVEIEVPHKEEIEILDKMLEILKTPSRWCKNKYSVGRSYCLYGALNIADHGYPRAYSEITASYQKDASLMVDFRLTDLTPCKSIVAFNDSPSTTYGNIKALLIRARASFE